MIDHFRKRSMCNLRLSLWDVLPPLQEDLDEIASMSAQRIEWQRKFPSMRTSRE